MAHISWGYMRFKVCEPQIDTNIGDRSGKEHGYKEESGFI